MNKILNIFLVLSLILSNSTRIIATLKTKSLLEYIDIIDPNFEKALIEQKIDTDGELNKKVLKSDIDNIKKLSINGNNITNLDGIEGFLNLEELFVSYNKLSQLNLSKNIKLRILNCDMNNLDSINLVENINLVQLICDRNKLFEIDLSKNVNLKYLFCQENKFVKLDLTRNALLSMLRCEKNSLVTLNLNENSALYELKCGYNSIERLDLTKNIKIQNLYCEKNKLRVLNISMCKDFVNLFCWGNFIEKIDISQNIALKDLYCSENKLSNLNISNNINLLVLSCAKNKIDSIIVQNVVKIPRRLVKDDFTKFIAMDSLIKHLEPLKIVSGKLTMFHLNFIDLPDSTDKEIGDLFRIEFHIISKKTIKSDIRRISDRIFEIPSIPKGYFNGVVLYTKDFYGTFECLNLNKQIDKPIDFYLRKITKKPKKQYFDPCPYEE